MSLSSLHAYVESNRSRDELGLIPIMPINSNETKKQSERTETEFTRWLAGVLEREKQEGSGIDLSEIARRAGSDYNYLWRLSIGERKPSLEKVIAIGKAVGDPIGAVRAFDPQFLDAVLEDVNRYSSIGIKKIRIAETEQGPIDITVPSDISDDQLKRIKTALSLVTGATVD